MSVIPRRDPGLYRPHRVQPSRLSEFTEGLAWGFLLGAGLCAALTILAWVLLA